MLTRQECGFVPPPTGLSGTVAQMTRSGSGKPLKEVVMSTNAVGPRGLIRQGDVLLIRVDRRVVLAEGEATGHAHAILDGQARLEVQNFGEYRRRFNSGHWTGSRTVLIVEEAPATIVHEEHDPLAVSPGAYLVRRQREYIPAERESARWRRVAD